MGSCPQCQQVTAADARFCSVCGLPVSRVVAQREERKRVSVLFCDLVGFTSRSEHLDVEDIRTLLTPYYGQVRAILERHGGTVEKFIGDAVVGVFGAPQAREDDAERAVRAALSIRDRMRELNDVAGLDLHVRLAVTTGPALVSLDARVRDGEGLVVGDVVNTAARLQAAAPEDGVLVDDLTRRLTDQRVVYQPSSPLVPRGKTEAVATSVAAGLQPGVRADEGGPTETRMVGRETELSLLTEAVDRITAHRRAELIVLVGAPGMGKSRMMTELRQRTAAGSPPLTWLQGRCLPYGDDVTLSALCEIVKEHLEIIESDTEAQAHERVRSTVTAFGLPVDEADWLRRHLALLVGIGDVGDAAGNGPREAFAAWSRFLELIADQRPTVLVLEDLHWADPLLLDFVDHVLTSAERFPLLVIATARPEFLARRPTWQQTRPQRTLVPLAPLSSPDTARLLTDLLGRHVLPAEIQSPLLERSGGNPLYAKEWVRMLADRGHLRLAGGRNWTTEVVAELQSLPPSVEGIIAARLDTLDAEHKQLVQLAAVLGTEGWLHGLAAVGSLDHGTVEERFEVLERRDLLRREPDSVVAGEPEYAFTHAVVREVAYAQIPRSVRGDWHQRSARWISELAPERLHDRAELLAYHWKSAHELATSTRTTTRELTDAARMAMRGAGDRSRQLHAYAAAASWYQQALAIWPVADLDRPRLQLHLGSALAQAHSAGITELEEAYTGLVAQGDHELAADASRKQAGVHFGRGEDDEGQASLSRALDLLASKGPSLAKASVLADAAMELMISGRSTEALSAGRQALDMADALGLDHPVARCGALTAVGVTRLESGETAGLDDLQQALDICLTARCPPVVEYHNLATAAIAVGDLSRGFALNAEALASARTYAMSTDLRLVAFEQAWESYWRGDWTASMALADRALDQAEEGLPHFSDAGCQQVRGLIRLARGDATGAVADLAVTVELAARQDELGALQSRLAQQAWALLLSGDVGAAHDAADGVLALLRHGARLASPDWSGPLAMVLDGLGRAADFAAPADRVRLSTRWLDAARAIAAQDFDGAAEVYAAIGSRPDEALARLRAGEQHRLAGRGGQARLQLGQSLDFWHAVGARSYVHRIESSRTRYA